MVSSEVSVVARVASVFAVGRGTVVVEVEVWPPTDVVVTVMPRAEVVGRGDATSRGEGTDGEDSYDDTSHCIS